MSFCGARLNMATKQEHLRDSGHWAHQPPRRLHHGGDSRDTGGRRGRGGPQSGPTVQRGTRVTPRRAHTSVAARAARPGRLCGGGPRSTMVCPPCPLLERHTHAEVGAHTLARPHALPSQDVSSLQVAGTRQTGEDVRSQNGECPTQLAQSGRRRQGRHHTVCCARPRTGEVQREPRLRVWAATLSRHVRRASGASPCAASLADTPVCWLFCCDPPSQRLRRDCQHREEQPRTGGPGQGAAVTCAVAGLPRAPVPSHFRGGGPPFPLPARCLSTTWVTSPSPTTGPPS